MTLTYLVTGAAGFIGSHVAERLLARGCSVWTIDNFSTGQRSRIPDGVICIDGNCHESATIARLREKKFDAILHFAGQSSGQISFDDPVYDLESNLLSTVKLAQYAVRTGTYRFIYASSMSVYGNSDQMRVSEDMGTSPSSFYGEGKLAAERYLAKYKLFGLAPTSMRLFNVYGPHQNLTNMKQGMVSIYLAQMIQSERIVVRGSLERIRDFVFISDVTDFVCRIVDEPQTYGRILNLGTGRSTRVGDLILGLMKHLGVEREIVVEEGTPGDSHGFVANMDLTRSLTGFEAQVDLDKGMSETIRWAVATEYASGMATMRGPGKR